VEGTPYNHVYRIVHWAAPAPSVTSASGGTGAAVADPRHGAQDYAKTKYRVTPFDAPSRTVIGASTTGDGAFAVADPRTGFGPDSHRNKLAMVRWDRNAGTVTGSDRVGSGALSVADPRVEGFGQARENFQAGGHYGVMPWDEHSGAVASSSQHDNGRWSVADPRVSQKPASDDEEKRDMLPEPSDRLVAVIRALDGTWHRPFTTLELAALQGLVQPEETLELDGLSDSAWRERIGNAVPPPAAQAIASVMGRTLLLAWSGETTPMAGEPIWVRPVATALMAGRAL
jgi:site-specific DNA-cytosine methylase